MKIVIFKSLTHLRSKLDCRIINQFECVNYRRTKCSTTIVVVLSIKCVLFVVVGFCFFFWRTRKFITNICLQIKSENPQKAIDGFSFKIWMGSTQNEMLINNFMLAGGYTHKMTPAFLKYISSIYMHIWIENAIG